MAQIKKTQPLLPSVLDRLLDDNPSAQQEAAASRAQVMRELHACIRRDLQNLLNTRRRCLTLGPEPGELEQSLVNYGIPDFSGGNFASAASREEFRRTMENVIRRFEPRFKTVRVQLLENTDTHDQTLRFRIDALVYADPAPEPVAFDSLLEPVTYSFEVKGAQHD
ncbi:MAG: type VI secretion system baseplate subunit TssE [Gammaproteobacteria bacterium]